METSNLSDEEILEQVSENKDLDKNGVLDDWDKAQMYREAKYHNFVYSLLEGNTDMISLQLIKATSVTDFESNQDFFTFALRNTGNLAYFF